MAKICIIISAKPLTETESSKEQSTALSLVCFIHNLIDSLSVEFAHLIAGFLFDGFASSNVARSDRVSEFCYINQSDLAGTGIPNKVLTIHRRDASAMASRHSNLFSPLTQTEQLFIQAASPARLLAWSGAAFCFC